MEGIRVIAADPTGYEILTKAVKALLNQFPGLDGKTVYFEELGEESGLAFSADAGALVISERRSITDRVTQSCQYPFILVYRTTATREFQKLNVSSFLDSVGKWICKEPVEVNGKKEKLVSYPSLSDGRRITRVVRNNVYATVPNENKSQDWVLPVTVQYTYEFDL